MDKVGIYIIVTLLLISSGCSRNPDETGIEIFPDMVHSVGYEAYSENSIMADGKTNQLPPEGSIARNKLPFPYGKGEAEAKRAGQELVNPFAETKQGLERGRSLYTNYCLACHGVQGKGDGPLIPKFPNPPSLTAKRLLKYEDGRLYHIITEGSGDMPSHKEQINSKDRWFLVQYVNYIQETYRKK